MPKPPRPPPREKPPAERKLVISPQVTVKWREGLLRVAPRSGREIESRDPTMLWLLHEFATPRLPKEVAGSLPSTPAATLETAIADLQTTGILVPAPPDATPGSAKAPNRESSGKKPRRKSIPGTEQAELTASVIMATRNRARHLDYTLASYLTQTDERFELVIVDDGSTDDTADVVSNYEGRLYIRHLRQGRVGRPAARNAGLREAEGAIVIFSDDDRIVSPTFVARHLAAYQDASDNTFALGWTRGITSVIDRGLVGPAYPVLAAKLSASAPKAPESLTLFEPSDVTERFEQTVREFGTADPDWEQRLGPVLDEFDERLDDLDVAWFLAAIGNLSAPRAAVLDAGLFDEGYRGLGLEGADLCYALARAGAKATLARDAVSYHQLHARRDLSDERQRSLRYFHHKHERLEARLFLWWLAGAISIGEANRITRAAKTGRAATDPVLLALDKAVAELIESKLLA